ncbi:hypothetical protein MRX96_000816 [Rhipicephalus microplus]
MATTRLLNGAPGLVQNPGLDLIGKEKSSAGTQADAYYNGAVSYEALGGIDPKHMVQTQMASTYPQYVTQNGGERADGKDGSFALPIVTTNGVEQQTIVKQKLSADAGAAARMRIAYLEQQPGALEARDITGAAVDKAERTNGGSSSETVECHLDVLWFSIKDDVTCALASVRSPHDRSGVGADVARSGRHLSDPENSAGRPERD